MKRSVSLFVTLFLLAGCLAAGTFSSFVSAESQLTDEEILAQRRDIAEAYMRKMTSIIWRAEEDLVYTTASGDYAHPLDAEAAGKKVLKVHAGELYQGMPYSYAGGDYSSFMDYCSEPDEKGIYNLSGLTWEALSGGSTRSPRIGNDCSGAVMRAYSQIGNSFVFTTTAYMVEERGYLRVGNYTSPTDKNSQTTDVCKSNGKQTMFEAYAQLQKADSIVAYYSSSGHTRMVVGVKVVRNADGTINGSSSKVTVLEQTSTLLHNATESKRRYFDEELGEYVNVFCGVDLVYTFNNLYNEGYLPITIKELIDPSPVSTPYAIDTLTAAELNGDTLLSGELQSNYPISQATITITDGSGKVVQQATASGYRNDKRNSLDPETRYYYFSMDKFVTDKPVSVQGYLNPDKLSPGSYHCNVKMELSAPTEIYTMRDFDFTVEPKDASIDHSGTACPMCGAADATWELLPAPTKDYIDLTETKHYYLDADIDYTAEDNRHIFNVKADSVICVDLNGYSITSGLRTFLVDGGGTLNITGPDSSVVDGGAVGLYNGNALDVCGIVNIYGGTYKHHNDSNPVVCLRNSGAVVTMYGGVIDGTSNTKAPNVLLTAGTFHMHGGKVTGGNSGADYAYGGNFYIGYIPEGKTAKQCKVFLYGGTVEGGIATTTGGNIYVENHGELFIRNEAVISGGTATGSHGGNVAVVKNGFALMTGGKITGGKAASRGGNVYIHSGGTFNMTGGVIEKGNATNGGNIESYGTDSTAIISGGLVTEGVASSRGGNIYAYGDSSNGVGYLRVSGTANIANGKAKDGGNGCSYGGNVVINDGTIQDGVATQYGGNLYTQSSGNITIQGGLVKDGEAATEGGNLYAKSNSTVELKNGGKLEGGVNKASGKSGGSVHIGSGVTFTMGADANDTCSITGGNAPRWGGNIFVGSSAHLIIRGGEISGGTSGVAARNVAIYDAIMTMTGGRIISASSAVGNGIYISGASTLNLGGTAKVLGANDRRSGNIWINSSAKLQMANDFVGNASVSWADSVANQTYGGTIPAANGVCGDTSGTYTGKLTHESIDGDPNIFGVNGSLKIAGAQVIGKATKWVATNADAVAVVQNGEYIKLYTNNSLTLTTDTYLDINGHTVTATGTGKVYGIDSSNDDYEGNGTLTYAGEIAAATTNPVTGKQYVAIVNDGAATFHRLGAQMTAVTLRPDAAGVYFKAKYQCDDALAALVKNYGVVLSVNNMPGADFATEEGDINIATVGKEAFVSGLETTSTSVFGILKENRKPELNDRYGKMPIYANTYVELADGTIVMGENGTSQSLYDVLQTIDANWADYAEHQASVLEFFRAWEARGISSWKFENIK